MKTIGLFLFLYFFALSSFAQVSGNINYQQYSHLPENNINALFSSNSGFLFSIKGLANIKADEYVAIFSVTQGGKTAREVNEIINKRISVSLDSLKKMNEIDVYVDMITFVPVYEFELEKKVFSKKTYNEIPSGFQLKKNLHIKFKNPDQLNQIITILAENEIYDLVKVDYFSTDLEKIKKQMNEKALALGLEKMAMFEKLSGSSFANSEKRATDMYKVFLPLEMYQSYEAYSSSEIMQKKQSNYKQANKETTPYYQAIQEKEFDFVINPVILEPVIQVLYELKISIDLKSKDLERIYMLITPQGELKTLNINK
jgi:uncharacterized protein YggE